MPLSQQEAEMLGSRAVRVSAHPNAHGLSTKSRMRSTEQKWNDRSRYSMKCCDVPVTGLPQMHPRFSTCFAGSVDISPPVPRKRELAFLPFA